MILQVEYHPSNGQARKPDFVLVSLALPQSLVTEMDVVRHVFVELENENLVVEVDAGKVDKVFESFVEVETVEVFGESIGGFQLGRHCWLSCHQSDPSGFL